MKSVASISDRIIDVLKDAPAMTATQLAKAIKASPASVSVAVLRLVKRGRIVRTAKPGPRGGKTYAVPATPDPTLWDRLRENDLL